MVPLANQGDSLVRPHSFTKRALCSLSTHNDEGLCAMTPRLGFGIFLAAVHHQSMPRDCLAEHEDELRRSRNPGVLSENRSRSHGGEYPGEPARLFFVAQRFGILRPSGSSAAQRTGRTRWCERCLLVRVPGL